MTVFAFGVAGKGVTLVTGWKGGTYDRISLSSSKAGVINATEYSLWIYFMQRLYLCEKKLQCQVLYKA